jgi:integrase
MAKPLTDSAVSNLHPMRGQTGWREIADGASRGLCLRLSPTGEKVWAVRHAVAGKRQRHTVGAYPAVTLSAARKRAGEYLSAARDGQSAIEVEAKVRALTMTVEQAHGEYLATIGAGLRAHTLGLKKGLFSDHIGPAIGAKLIRMIRRPDVTEAVGAVAAKGFPVQANRVFSELMALLRWCEQKGYLDGVPSVRKKDMRHVGAAKEQARRRTLSDPEIAELWAASGELGDLTGDFLRLLLLTGQRRDEVRLIRREHVDLDHALWTIPAEVYKTGVAHAVPLPDAAVAILRARWGDAATGYLLPSRKPGRPFNGAASAARRLRPRMPGRAPFTLHDLRRTVRTGLSRLGVDGETAEMVIGHLPQGISRVYNLHDRLEEKRAALSAWARHVQSILDGTSNVVQLARAG